MSEARPTMNGKPVFTVPTKAVFNFDSGFKHKLLCDGATFTAGNACVYSCAYCYVESMQLKSKARFESQGVVYPKEGHLGVVIRTKDAVERAKIQLTSYPAKWRKEKRVIYSSPKVDVAGNMELVRETVEICKLILEMTNWDIRLLSKSNLLPMVAKGLIQDLADSGIYAKTGKGGGDIARERIIFGVSAGTLDDKLAKAFEEGTPLVSKRIESLHWLQDNGFRTFGMICPSLPQWLPGQPDGVAYDRFANDMAQVIRAERCETIWTEVINVRGDSFTRTEKCLRDAGYSAMADELRRVSFDQDAWENYARLTFEAHAQVYNGNKSPDGSPKLKHLQYVNKKTRAYWQSKISDGAILL